MMAKKAKFRVGQIIAIRKVTKEDRLTANQYAQIVSRQADKDGFGSNFQLAFGYGENDGRVGPWWNECTLRPLTRRERGA